jgi:hypothetical protein
MFLLLACSQTIAPGAAPTTDPSSDWDATLARVVKRSGNVDYAALEADPAPLDDYIAWLAVAPDPALEGDEALARSINAYNAFVLKGVLANRPLTSVRNVSVGIFAFSGSGFFKGLKFTYNDDTVDLSGFENDHIREDFEDPRIHAAINCASAGCPPLRAALYTADGLDAQLDTAMAIFIDSRSRIEGDEAVFSEIFSWFNSDFIDWGESATLCDYAAAFDPAYAPLAEAGCPHRFEDYDWSLNEAQPFTSEVSISSSWDYAPSPGDCPPFMTPGNGVCSQASPFAEDADADAITALLETGAFGARSLCSKGICAPPDPAFTTCSILGTKPACRVLRENEARWDWLAETCHTEGMDACLPRARSEAMGEPVTPG